MWKTTQWASNVSSILRTESPYVGSKTVLDSGFQVLDSRFQSVDSGFQILESRLQSVDSGFQVLDSRFQSVESGFQVVDYRFQSVDPGFQVLDPTAFLISRNAVELRFRTPSRRKLDSGLQSLEGVRIPWDEFWIQNHEFRIPKAKFSAFRNPHYLQGSKRGEMEQSHVSLFLTWYLVKKSETEGIFLVYDSINGL